MESTAVYWMPIWRILENDFKLYLVNPLSIKSSCRAARAT